MKSIEEYEAIHDFWIDLKSTAQDYEFRMTPVGTNSLMLMSRSTIRHYFNAQLLVERKAGPSSLRVRSRSVDDELLVLTRLDFWPPPSENNQAVRRIGHLTIIGQPNLQTVKQEVVSPFDMPFEQIAQIDDGLDILDFLTPEA